MQNTSISNRAETLAAVRNNPEVSVLIVGGGVNGAGLFRELALQGIDVLLVDKSDFCAGASAASSRMIHGGLRYMEFGEFRLVRESLHERNLLLKNAPHYVNPLPTTIPVYYWFSGIASCIQRFFGIEGTRPAHRGRLMVKLGLTFYDIFTRKMRLMPTHSFTNRTATFRKRPKLNPKTICTANFYDAWISYPERLCLELLMDGEAMHSGARAANYVKVKGAKDSSVTLEDELTGDTLDLKPQLVVNATGAWIDFTNRAMGHDTKLMGGTKGAHLVIDNEELFQTLDGEMVYYENDDGRVAIVFPWLGKVLMGSTDIRIDNPDEAKCEKDEIDYMLEALREVFPKLVVERDQIVSHFSGVRPLANSDGATVAASRDHKCEIAEPSDGIDFPVFSLIGGKWTTFRGFAEHVTDILLPRLGKDRVTDTESVFIGGGEDFPKKDDTKQHWIDKAEAETGIDKGRLTILLARYGTRATQVAEFIAAGNDARLENHLDYSRREIEFIIRYEGVTHLDDLVLRRTVMALLGELNNELLEELASITSGILGWSDETVSNEITRTKSVLSERFGINL